MKAGGKEQEEEKEGRIAEGWRGRKVQEEEEDGRVEGRRNRREGRNRRKRKR